ncbi:hypothetical protein BGZ76_000991 [Entomortierella beljakovae]|nr:hypothetical protein BGZ76_000991 [Entomortierella beljakovae]
MAVDLCILHFRIPDHCPTTLPEANDAIASPALDVGHRANQSGWKCQLSILEDKSTLRANLEPFDITVANRMELKLCCTLQVMTIYDFDGGSVQVLMTKRIKSDALFKNGIECKALSQ